MSGPEDSERGPSEQPEGASVLANLPRTRPQRASARRAAARRTASPNGARAGATATLEQPAPARGARKPAASTPRQRKSARPRSTAAGQPAPAGTRRTRASSTPREPVPRQGYASEGDTGVGPVQPPGGAELFASAVEIVGELTKTGVATGERWVKDLFSRLSPS